MRLPVEVERKLGMINACGLKVSVNLSLSGIKQDMSYDVTIGNETKEFDNDEDFYEYIDKRLKEAVAK